MKHSTDHPVARLEAQVPHQRTPPDPSHEPAVGPRQPWTVLVLMLLAQFMVILDVSVVNIALPSIGADLALTSGQYQWAVSAYVLCSGGLLLLGGRIADVLPRRGIFLTGLGLFTAASLAGGLAGSALGLILPRAAQGVGAAMLTPAAMSILMSTYTGKQRQLALAVWGAIGSSGIAAGVLFGGLLTSAAGWQAVFFINVPIGIAVAALVARTVPSGERTLRDVRSLDLPGAAALVTGLVLLVYAIERAHTTGWGSPRTWLLLGIAAVLLTAFATIERRTATPLVPPHAWKIRSLMSSTAVMAGVTGAVVGAIFLSSLYLQRQLGSSAVVAGLQFLPLALVITAAAMTASKLVDRITPRVMIAAGLVVMGAGALFLAASGGGTSYLTDVLPGFVLIGAGVGPMFVAISIGAMSDVPPQASGVASGIMMTGHEIGAALGVALLTTVAGDVTTAAGLVAGYGRSFVAVAVALAALFVLTVLTAPNKLSPTGAAHGQGNGHGHGHGH